MKNVLILIQDMCGGGAEKSLISFLRCLEQSEDKNQYDIDLMVAKPEGIFYSQIPQFIHIIKAPKALLWLATPFDNPLLKENMSLLGILGKSLWYIRRKLKLFGTNLNEEQKLWICWKKLIPTYKKEYDIAISYMNGFPNYYIVEKIKAKKKVLWIHNEYQKIRYDRAFDRPFYEKAGHIITISQKCKDSFTEMLPEFANKISVLENITIKSDILARGNEGTALEFENFNGLKILSVGRLTEQKQFGLAIDAAKVLKQRGVNFSWIIVGEGPERIHLQGRIDQYGLNDCFQMIGVRENPYIYIRACDVFVQTSRYEGKSIVLDEAKIFDKPIVVTNYPTVYDSIENDKNGIIVPMDGKQIADGIGRIWSDNALRYKLCDELKRSNIGNEKELEKYINVML